MAELEQSTIMSKRYTCSRANRELFAGCIAYGVGEFQIMTYRFLSRALRFVTDMDQLCRWCGIFAKCFIREVSL